MHMSGKQPQTRQRRTHKTVAPSLTASKSCPGDKVAHGRQRTHSVRISQTCSPAVASRHARAAIASGQVTAYLDAHFPQPPLRRRMSKDAALAALKALAPRMEVVHQAAALLATMATTRGMRL